MPALREVAISGRYGGNLELTMFGAFAGCPILPQLRALSISNLRARADGHGDGLQLETLAPRFHHLERFHVDEIEPDDDAADFATRCHAALPNLTCGAETSS